MMNFVLFAYLLLAQVGTSDEAIGNPDLGVSVSAAPGWSAQATTQEPDLAFRLLKGSEANADMFLLRVKPTQLDLKSHWISLRYSVVIDLGGKILKDQPYQFLGAKGRMLTYKAVAPATGKQRIFMRACAVKDGKLYVAHAAMDPAAFAREREEVVAMLQSLRATAP